MIWLRLARDHSDSIEDWLSERNLQTELGEGKSYEHSKTGCLDSTPSSFHGGNERGRDELKLRERKLIVRERRRNCQSGIRRSDY